MQELRGIGEDVTTHMMGIGYLGEVRQGPDGNHYQYVQGVDGLGNPIGGFWSMEAWRVARCQPCPASCTVYSRRALRRLTAATPILKQAGVAGYDGLGALYQAPDGTVYQSVSESEAARTGRRRRTPGACGR